MLRNWRKTLGVTLVAVGMTVPVLTVSTSTVRAATSDCAAALPSAVGPYAPRTLCVESSSDGPHDPPYDTHVFKGQRIDTFKWMVNEDDSTGDPSFTADNIKNCLPGRAKPTASEIASNATLSIYATAGDGLLSDCQWPSVHNSSGHSTVIADGDQSDIANLDNLGDGKYLISVVSGGFKIDGVHFVVSGHMVVSVNEEDNKPFIVRMNPLPKKTNTVRVHVFNDNASTNSQWDGQTETLITCDLATPQQLTDNCGGQPDPLRVADPTTDMSGFSVKMTDVLAEVTTDVYGNPLCTQYEQDDFGNILLNDDGTPNPVVFPNGGTTGGAFAGTQSTCLSDHYGDIVVPNMGPNRYAVTVVPPDPRTHHDDVWVRTTTLEGGHDWDAWLIEGIEGYDTELVVGGERVPPVIAGFVKLTNNDRVWKAAEATRTSTNPNVYTAQEQAYYNASSGFLGGAGNGIIKGRIMIGRAYIGSGGASPLAGTNLANAKTDGPVEDGVVSVSCLATCNAPTDQMVWAGRARPDGTFQVNHLQTGDYVVAFWDETQDYILAVMQYHVTSSTNPAVNVVSATAPGGVPTVTFSNNAGLIPQDIVYFTSQDANWNGNFEVKTVTNNGRTVTLQGVTGQKPSAAPTSPITVNTTDVGEILLPGWFTELTGVIFNDLNGNGKRDIVPATGQLEPGIPDFTLTERTRGNSLQDQGQNLAVTNDEGEFDLTEGYPLGQYLILEAYNPRYKNTGYTYRTDNDGTTDSQGVFHPNNHTVLTSQVDIAFNPVIGLSGEVDWGVQAYGTGADYWSGADTTQPAAAPAAKYENGGIVGTVTYDSTRNEFDPAYSAQEDYQPGVSDIPMQLWKTHKTDGVHPDVYTGVGASGAVQQWGLDATTGAECLRPDQSRGKNAVTDSGQNCKPYDYYVTESFQRPVGCEALDVNGNHLTGELALPDAPPHAQVDYSHNPDNLPANIDPRDPRAQDCLDAPMESLQIGGNGTVDGNYALTSLMDPAVLTAAVGRGDDLEALYGDAQNNPDMSHPLTNGDYVVEAVNPIDAVAPAGEKTSDPTVGGYTAGGTAKRLYRFTDETAINVMSGDSYVPQYGYAASGAAGGDPYGLKVQNAPIRFDQNSLGAGTVALCAGSMHTVDDITTAGSGQGQDAINPDLNGAGGNPYAGRDTPICDAKVVTVTGGRSMPAGFFMYTDVPAPTKFYGLVNDDLNVDTDRRSILLGEVAPASNVPVGVYDENGNWKLTAHSDVNGFYEILLPSTDTYNCPLPAGPCPNVYRLVGNDPGTLAHRNLDYNPAFRTIATEFQGWPGVVHPVDQAPVHNGITIEGPAAQFGAISLCKVNQVETPPDQITPEFYAIDKPYYDPATDSGHPYEIKGYGFGTSGLLRLGSTTITVSPGNWTDTDIKFSLTNSTLNPAPYQLSITNGQSHRSAINTLTFHRLSPNSGTGSTSYLRKNDVYEVKVGANQATDTDNPGQHTFTPVHDAWDPATSTPIGFFGTDVNGRTVGTANNTSVSSPNGRAIQRAIQAAYNASNRGNNAKLVVIYPNTADNYAPHNPFAAYFENVVLHGKVKLQGVGPGGATSSTDIVLGTNIDASFFWSATQVVPPGGNQDTADGSYSDDWRTFADSIGRTGSTADTELPEGEAVLAIAEGTNQVASSFSGRFTPGVDGIMLSGGDQNGNPGNINVLPGTRTDSTPQPTPPGPSQGGAVTLDQYVRDFNITNNLVQSNGGTYGTVRIGTPDIPGNTNTTSNHNDRVNIANNRFVANAGTNLAGALGLFAGSNGYTVTGNDFCGNYSSEYGGGISHYGRSDNGRIANNRVYYNQGYDEGGGIFVAGQLPANNNSLSPGAGAVTIDSNIVIANQSNDDGGGLRFLMASGQDGDFAETVTNNIIANNVSTHEGGGIALDDAANVTLLNNTIVKNITTATAATNAALSGGVQPANPAGLSTARNSSLLQTRLVQLHGAGTANWSVPKMLNNIFADNRAGWAKLPTTVNFNESSIHGIGDPLDTSQGIQIQRWDIGIVGSQVGLTPTPAAGFGAGVSNTTNTRIVGPGGLQNIDQAYAFAAPGANNIDPSTDGTVTIGFAKPQDFLVDSLTWRNNTNVSFPVIVAQMVPVSLLADYHLRLDSSNTLAVDSGSTNLGTTNAPSRDIDGDNRPQLVRYDRGADELRGPTADLSITKTDGRTTVNPGDPVSYTIVVTNAGPDPVTGATVTDTVPATLTGATWTCAGAGCSSASGNGNVNATVNLTAAASVTFTVNATVAANATGSVSNTASVAAPALVSDAAGNNSATDVDAVIGPKPTLSVLDNFNRANANNLGGNWNQLVIFGSAGLRVNANQATSVTSPAHAYWNTAFSVSQAAAVTIANTTINGDSLILKAAGNPVLNQYQNFIRVQYQTANGGQVVVEYSTNWDIGSTNLGTFPATFVSGDTLTARANADGSVDVWKTTAANVTTFIGHSATSPLTGGGAIGLQLSNGARVDNFAGGSV